jgi:hypothetical protein
MLALEGGIDVLKPEILTGVDNQLVAEVHRLASSYPCFAPAVYIHTRTYYLAPRGWKLHLSVDQDSFSQFSSIGITKCAPSRNARPINQAIDGIAEEASLTSMRQAAALPN